MNANSTRANDALTPTPSVGDALARPLRAAIVEDNPSVREILASWLAEAPGFQVCGVFSDVESALPALPGAAPDVVLLDINLPGQSGIDCVRQMKPVLPTTQFVMLTVYEDSNYIFDALSSGATGYLVKTTTRHELLAALREVHAGGSPMSGNIARKVVQSLQKPSASPSAITGQLSRRENEVLGLLARGFLYKEIADSLQISTETVNTYIRRIYEKLHVHSRAQAVALFTNLPPYPRP